MLDIFLLKSPAMNMSTLFVTLISFLVLAPMTEAKETRTRHAILIGVDGTTGQAMHSLTWQSDRAPNLKRLMSQGQFASCLSAKDANCARAHQGPRTNSELRWKTGPGWASVLTGLDSIHHRVGNNPKEKLLAFAESTRANPTFLKQLHDLGMPVAASGVSAFMTSSDGDFGVIDFECTSKQRPFGPRFNEISSCNLDERLAQSSDDSNRDEKLKSWIIEKIGSGRFSAIMGVFDQIDAAGHSNGFDNNAAYLKAIQNFDRQLGEIVAAIESRPNEEWLVIITSDHGGHNILGHGNHDKTPDLDDSIPFAMQILNSNNSLAPLVAPVTHMDVQPTILKWFSLPQKNSVDGKPQGL